MPTMQPVGGRSWLAWQAASEALRSGTLRRLVLGGMCWMSLVRLEQEIDPSQLQVDVVWALSLIWALAVLRRAGRAAALQVVFAALLLVVGLDAGVRVVQQFTAQVLVGLAALLVGLWIGRRSLS